MDSTRIDHPTVLSIRIDTDGFSFLFYDDSNRLISQKHVQFDFYSEDIPPTLFQSQAELKANYASINISCVSPYYSLIPLALFQTEMMRPLLQLQCPDLPSSYTILYHQIDSQQSVLIYAMPQGIIQMVEEVFPTLQIDHHLKRFLQSTPVEKESLTVLVREKDCDIIAYSNQRIVLTNNFQHDCVEDLAYHVLNCIHELEFDSASCTCSLYGKDTKKLNDLLSPHLTGLKAISKSEQDENYQWPV